MVASIGERDTGAVASAQAAEIYGLDILAEKIQVKLFPCFSYTSVIPKLFQADAFFKLNKW